MEHPATLTVGFVLVGQWTVGVRDEAYPFGLPVPDTDLAIVGAGLGLVIAPLSAVVLRVVPGRSHGVAAAGVVVARMTGMLVGLAALSAFGLWRFGRLTADLVPPLPFGMSEQQFNERLAAYTQGFVDAVELQYQEIFLVTAGLCLAGAALSLLLPGPDRSDAIGSAKGVPAPGDPA